MKLPGKTTLRTINSDHLLHSQMGRERITDEGEYTGMVWCPMKKSDIAVMRCGENQDQLGCGKRRSGRPRNGVMPWPWLLKTGVCKTRATEEQIRAVNSVVKERFDLDAQGKKELSPHRKLSTKRR